VGCYQFLKSNLKIPSVRNSCLRFAHSENSIRRKHKEQKWQIFVVIFFIQNKICVWQQQLWLKQSRMIDHYGVSLLKKWHRGTLYCPQYPWYRLSGSHRGRQILFIRPRSRVQPHEQFKQLLSFLRPVSNPGLFDSSFFSIS
jgi:hypothetical protein